MRPSATPFAADAVFERLEAAEALARRALGPHLAGLVQRRVESLLAGETVREAGRAPVEQSCLALADQFVADVSGVTEELTEPVRRRLGNGGLYALAVALYVFDARARLRLTLERVLP